MLLHDSRCLVALLFFPLALSLGCGKSTPDIVLATGTVTLAGKPLANADVRFVPMADGLDANFVASGITDADGKFELSLQGKSDPGCCACECKVLVDDPPLPAEVRSAYATNKLRVIKRYEASLKNRPIPEIYQKLKTTPLKVVVTSDQTEYDLVMKR